MPQLSLHSPVGDLTLSEADGALVALDWGWAPGQRETRMLGQARRQLEAYFDGDPAPFELPLAPAGSDFQRRVWERMGAIPLGRTLSYGELARELGSAARAVGAACGANPIPIIVPCHRVIAADGGLGGYSGQGGVETKQALLRLEGALLF
jgi:methylated-DNA-[protein]-cysteine S-methyltransferase